MSQQSDNKAVVAQFWSAFSDCRFDEALDLLHDDATWWVAGDLGGVSGTYTKEQCAPMFAGIAASTKAGVRVTPGIMTEEEDRVAMEATSQGVTVGGVDYANTYHILHVLRDGKIAMVREYMDPGRISLAFASSVRDQ